MGTYLVRLLSELNNTLVVTSRSDRENCQNVTYVKGDALDLEFLKRIITNDWDVIIDFMIYKTADFQDRIDLFLKSCSQYIYISSARIYADSVTPITEKSQRLLDISEDLDYLQTNEYSLIKARQEDMLLSSKNNNWTIIRPYITYSDSRFQLGIFEKEGWLYRAIKGRTIVIDKTTCEKITTLTYGFDVARTIANLAGKEDALGEIFNPVTDMSFKWESILNLYLDIIEKKLKFRAKIKYVSDESLLDILPVVHQLKYDRHYNRVFENSKIDKYICTRTFTQIEDGLKLTLEQFLDNPKFGHISWRSEAIKDRQCNEYTPISEIPNMKSRLIYLIYRNFYPVVKKILK